MKRLMVGFVLMSVLAGVVLAVSAMDARARGVGNPNPQPVVYVRDQGLYYDSIVTADPLPPNGPFQLLEMGPHGLETDYGPGDVGYKGGRWKEDFDGDGVFHYFLCPLQGPGREAP